MRIRLALAAGLAAAFAAGCGEDTPRGSELASPATREAAPADPGAAPEAGRAEEMPGLQSPEPGDPGVEPE